MKCFKFLAVVLLAFQFLNSQERNQFEGLIVLQDSLFIKYKIDFNENGGLISGYSLTDFGGEHETKSKIEGIYDEDSKRISFKEVALIYTKSPVSLNDFDFCNVNFTSKKFKLGADKMEGSFEGTFSDGTKCLNGELAMGSVEKIQKRVAKFSKKINKSKRVADSIKEKVKTLKLIDTLNLNVLKKNEITSIPTSSKKIILSIYDGGQIDNDVVTIYKDDKPILIKYKITGIRKTIEIPVENKIMRIKILSESVGTIGSNTAIVEVVNGNSTIKAMTNLKKGETTQLDILKIR